MQNEQPARRELVIRRAAADDYAAFTRLFPELLVDDPVPSLDAWATALAPSSFVASRGSEVLGYCYFEEYVDTGYVRNIVVAPSARRMGVGRALMRATADHFRSNGKASWRLNVKPENRAALALYEAMGLRVQYSAASLRLPWNALSAMPAASAGTQVRPVTPDRDAALESMFDSPRGFLGVVRARGRVLLEATTAESRPIGLSAFDPKFPGAFPFRALESGAASALLIAMRQHVPTDEYVNLTIEDDPELVALILRAGASVRMDILHLHGTL